MADNGQVIYYNKLQNTRRGDGDVSTLGGDTDPYERSHKNVYRGPTYVDVISLNRRHG